MKISGGLQQDGIVVGNSYDKYGSKNPVVRQIMKGFASSLSSLVAEVAPESIHEIGCGEGYWVIEWNKKGMEARGSDFSDKVIGLARENAKENKLSPSIFTSLSVYDVEPGRDTAELIVCCEVLEHLDDPEAGLLALQRVANNYVLLSVPREPLWCALNLMRGKYLANFGNTPGHLQHWSTNKFIDLVGRYFDIVKIEKPLPWTMLLCRVKG